MTFSKKHKAILTLFSIIPFTIVLNKLYNKLANLITKQSLRKLNLTFKC